MTLPKWIVQVAYLIVEHQASGSRYSGPDSYMGDDERREMEANVMEIIARGAAPLIVIAQHALKDHSPTCEINPCNCDADKWNAMVKEALQ